MYDYKTKEYKLYVMEQLQLDAEILGWGKPSETTRRKCEAARLAAVRAAAGHTAECYAGECQHTPQLEPER
jgi:hypothetical protein